MIDSLTVLLLVAGAAFFFAGTLGLLRFPDVYTRLHALTKADNLGLGLVGLGLILQADSALVGGKIVLVWVLVLIASGATSQLVVGWAQQRGLRPWKR